MMFQEKEEFLDNCLSADPARLRRALWKEAERLHDAESNSPTSELIAALLQLGVSLFCAGFEPSERSEAGEALADWVKAATTRPDVEDWFA